MEIYLLYGMAKSPKIRFFGVFSLNYSLLYVIMAATMSYLTVMVQFELDSSFSDKLLNK